MDYKALAQKMKQGDFSPVYLLYGEEAYLKEFYAKALPTSILGEEPNVFTLVQFEGAGIEIPAIEEAVESMPMMGMKKIVLLKDSGIFGSGKGELFQFWLEKVEDIPPFTTVIFVEKEVEKSSKKLTEKISAHEGMVEFTFLPASDLIKWVEKQLKAEGKVMGRGEIQFLIDRTEPGLIHLKNELEKLIALAGSETHITLDMVRSLVEATPVGKLFSLFDCIMEKKREEALKHLEGLKKLREPETKIVILLAKYLSSQAEIKLLMEKGIREPATIVKSTGAKDFVVKKSMRQLSGWTVKNLAQCVSECAEIDETFKSRTVNQWVCLENFVVKWASR